MGEKTTVITVCDTCAWGPDEKLRDGRSGGEAFFEEVQAAAHGREGVSVRRVSCLMGCDHPCNVAVSAPGKLSYVLGRFEPGADGAEALVDYAAAHAESDSGTVPYRSWPSGVKGKFIARVPPLDG